MGKSRKINKPPILTVVTRHMPNKRRLLMRRLDESLDPMRKFIQHLVVEDKDARGLRRSGELVVAVKDQVKGHFVWMLDDDDECTCAHLPQILDRVKILVDPDVVIIRGWYQLHGILPTNKHWEKKNFHAFKPPVPGTTNHTALGMPGLILRNEIWQRHIHVIATVDRWLDQALITAVQKGAKDNRYIKYYLDVLAMRQAQRGGGIIGDSKDKAVSEVLYGRTKSAYK